MQNSDPITIHLPEPIPQPAPVRPADEIWISLPPASLNPLPRVPAGESTFRKY